MKESDKELEELENLKDYDLDNGLSNEYNEMSPEQTNLLKSLVDFDVRLKSIVSSWLGLIWDESESKFIKNPNSEAIMNHKGVNWFIDLFRTYLDKTNTLTSITKKAYQDIMSDVIEVTWENIKYRCDEWEIKSLGDALKIGMQVEHSVSLMLLSLRGQGIKGVLKDNYRMNETGDNDYQTRKEGTVSKMIKKAFGSRDDF